MALVYTQKASQNHHPERRQHSIKALRLVLKEAGVRGALRPREKRDCSISLSRGLEYLILTLTPGYSHPNSQLQLGLEFHSLLLQQKYPQKYLKAGRNYFGSQFGGFPTRLADSTNVMGVAENGGTKMISSWHPESREKARQEEAR